MWLSEDPGTRMLGMVCAADDEPRIWRQPFLVYRDFVLRQELEAAMGAQPVAELYSRAAHAVDELAHARRALAAKNASQADRNWQPRPPTHLHAALVLAAYLDEVAADLGKPERAVMARCLSVSRRLGVTRFVVYRVVKSLMWSSLSGPNASSNLLALMQFSAVMARADRRPISGLAALGGA
ncbi:hypothetical protein [Cereibacter johrii]|uniref:hypothetical protein n=1 Tax=Cereibacter johrii TaxID=445629 RepID=UPI000DCEE9C7|nr:hypothetical protein [Cereibacter johrii]RAZ83504.1 hypothetical protein DDV93_14460 [Cereibacter johrii]